MKKTLFILLALAGMSHAATETVTLLPNLLNADGSVTMDFLQGAKPAGWAGNTFVNSPSAEKVSDTLKSSPNLVKTGWHASTGNYTLNGETYSVGTTDGTEVYISGDDTFRFKGRQAYRGEFVLCSVAVSDLITENEANSWISDITLNFDLTAGTNGTLFTIWSWDGETAQSLLGNATLNGTAFVTSPLSHKFTETSTNEFVLSGLTLDSKDTIIITWGNSSTGTPNTVSNLRSSATVHSESTDLYWNVETGGNWFSKSWATAEGSTEPNTDYVPGVTVHFTGDGTEASPVSIVIDNDVTVMNMTVSKGAYSFSCKDGVTFSGPLYLSISDKGVADFDMELTVAFATITDEGSALTGQTINVGAAFSMSGGSLKAKQLAGDGIVSITGGTLELTNGSTVGGGTTITGATLAGTTSLSDVTIGSVTVDATKVTLADSTLTGAVTLTKGTLEFSGDMELSADYSSEQVLVYSEDGSDSGAADGNGYAVTQNKYIVITEKGETVTNNANWTINGQELTWDSGALLGESSVNTDTYWINNGTVNYDTNMALMSRTNGTTSVNLNGGNLNIDSEYVSPATITSDTEGAKVILGANGVLHSSSIDNNSAKTIALSGSGQYHTDGSAELHATNRVTFATDWTGAVHTGDLSAPGALDITGLSQAGASVVMDHVTAQRITGGAAKQVSAKSLALGSGSSSLGADNVTLEALSLGTGAGAATLEITGSLTVKGDITLGHEKSSVTAASLRDTDALNFAMSTQVLNKTYGSTVLLTLTDATANGQGVNVVLNNGAAAANGKFTHTLGWSADYRQVVLNSVFNQQYFNSNATTPNGQAGAKLLTNIFETGNLQFNSDSQISKAIDGLDALIAAGDKVGADKLMAAVAGASTAAQGMALAGDVERQLRAIRNRTTTMGVNQCVVNEHMPYVNAWVNAEGNLGELDEDGTFAGYSLESWGGTIGVDVDVNPSFTLGLAVTAMYGNLSVSGPDMLEGDMDTVYLSAFARYASRAWTHTFIGTVGSMSGSYERTVSWDNGSYKTKGDTDGSAFGLMYELGRVIAIDDDGDACWQPVLNVAYRHASVGGYSETGSDAALKVGDQTLDTVTFGAGARLQAVVGENFYNRTSLLELRALAKLDAGDRSSEADVAFIGAGRKACVESAELGAFGVELGAGLHVPMGDEDSGTLFFDISAELRSGYSNVNGTVGYRINF